MAHSNADAGCRFITLMRALIFRADYLFSAFAMLIDIEPPPYFDADARQRH